MRALDLDSTPAPTVARYAGTVAASALAGTLALPALSTFSTFTGGAADLYTVAHALGPGAVALLAAAHAVAATVGALLAAVYAPRPSLAP